MTNEITAPKPVGMRVAGRTYQDSGYARHQKQLIYVCHMIEDPDFGHGIVGINQITGRPTIVFFNPIPSESRKKYKNTNTMIDWVNGVNVGGRPYTIGTGSYVFVSEITYRRSIKPREVEIDGAKYDADVIFIQWLRCWSSQEIIEQGNAKDIFTGYSICRSMYARSELGDGAEYARVDAFFPVGSDNRFNDEETGEEYPVVFSFNDLESLLAHIDEEAEKFHRAFSSYMVRMVNTENNCISDMGHIISVFDYMNPNEPASEVFAYNLARLLRTTFSGLNDFVSAEGFTFQIYGLIKLTPTVQSERGPSLMEEILNDPVFIPRQESDRNSSQSRYVAVPTAFRGHVQEETGTFWIDRAEIIGRVGYDAVNQTFSELSEIIDADSYSATPNDENGDILERGLDRESTGFQVNGEIIYPENVREFAKLLGCPQIEFPGGTWDINVFDSVWDDRIYEEDGTEPEPAPEPEPEVETKAEAPKTTVKQASTAKTAASVKSAAKPATKPGAQKAVKPATGKQEEKATPKTVAKPGGAFGRRPATKASPTQGSEDLGQAFPSEADGIDDVPF